MAELVFRHLHLCAQQPEEGLPGRDSCGLERIRMLCRLSLMEQDQAIGTFRTASHGPPDEKVPLSGLWE